MQKFKQDEVFIAADGKHAVGELSDKAELRFVQTTLRVEDVFSELGGKVFNSATVQPPLHSLMCMPAAV